MGEQGKVDLFILPPLNEIPLGLTDSEFLCVLEQYLIFKYRPKINKLFIARPGIIWSEDVIIRHRKKVGKRIYIYAKSAKMKNNLEFIYSADSASYASQLLGYERSWIKKILYRKRGWYKNKLYFSLVPLKTSNLTLGLIPKIIELKESGEIYTISNNLKDINKIKLYITKLLNMKGGTGRKGKMVRVTNVITKEVVLYRSKREAGRHLKADYSSFYNRYNNKLFRNLYRIEVLD